MSYFANALDQELKQANQTAAELARVSGLTEAHISRLKNGNQISVKPKDLAALAVALQKMTRQAMIDIHARLLYAHLRDTCSGPGKRLIEINLKAEPVQLNDSDASKSEETILPPAVQQNLDTITKHIAENRHARELIATIADFCQHQAIH